MQNNTTSARSKFMTSEDIFSIANNIKSSEAYVKVLLYVLGILLTPVSLFGALMGFKTGYNHFGFPYGEKPRLNKIRPIIWVSMFIGVVATWTLTGVCLLFANKIMTTFFGHSTGGQFALVFLLINLIFSVFLFRHFKKWQRTMSGMLGEQGRYGTARLATKTDFADLERKQGFYIGGEIYGYPKQGHFVTVGGARGGKGVNTILPNLLGLSGYTGSWFVVDIKGELYAISGRAQREMGQDVYVLDPFGISNDKAHTYNPLDLLADQENTDDLIADVDLLAEMIVPKTTKGEAFWDNRARTLIAGLILHLVTTEKKENRTLTKIWSWLRSSVEEFENLLSDMAASDNAIVRATGNEYANIIHTAEKMFQSIMSSALEKTDFLKSPALQKSMASSSFDIKDLTNGKTSLYVLFPPERLDTHYQWLRLVMTTALRNAGRHHDKRLTFLLDEFAALGYIPLMRTALSTYAGYNISMWPIVQDLGQLKNLYGDSWETFISNTVVRQFLSVSDVFSLEYISRVMGTTTTVTYEYDDKGGAKANGTARPLMSPDEIRRASADNIFAMVEQRPIILLPKKPYYEMPTLDGKHDPNPYYKP